MIEVWHRKHPTFVAFAASGTDEHKAAWQSGDYEMVAEVECPPPQLLEGIAEEEYAFAITNNIDSLWTENEGVKAVRKDIRSTSTGDVVKRSDGTLLLCAAIGWVSLT